MQKGESLKKYYTSPESPYNYEKESSSSSSSSSSSISKISPLILLVIIVLALIFFVYGIVHLVLWFLMKTPSSSSPYQSSHRLTTTTTTTTDPTRGARALQRQLHHLFRLHDSGLQQSLIDTLPLFFYEDVVLMGSISKEPFDCAVCLCEFSHHDKLRLLPMCSHAFHIDCIDTWLLSNSTCPLCRTTVSSSSSGLSMENPLFSVENLWGLNRDEENANGVSDSGEDQNGVKRVFSVRLGKFRNINGGVDDVEEEGSSNTNREARRCYSMGSYQYVVSGSDLQVVLLSEIAEKKNEEEDVGRKRMIGERSRRESFSVSKIWLWSNKSKFHCSSTAAADFP